MNSENLPCPGFNEWFCEAAEKNEDEEKPNDGSKAADSLSTTKETKRPSEWQKFTTGLCDAIQLYTENKQNKRELLPEQNEDGLHIISIPKDGHGIYHHVIHGRAKHIAEITPEGELEDRTDETIKKKRPNGWFYEAAEIWRKHEDEKIEKKSMLSTLHSLKRGTSKSAGIDLTIDGNYTVPAKSMEKIKLKEKFPYGLGKTVEITMAPKGYMHETNFYEKEKAIYGLIAPRSSTMMRGILMPSTIADADYTGDLSVIIYNFTEAEIELKEGESICQIVISKYIDIDIPVKEEIRGNKGFGSTGK